jgi:tetratricopeptide (TPR) repeat protein
VKSDNFMNAISSSSFIWGVPYQRNPFFTGREDILERLHEAFAVENWVGLSQAQGVHGLGGIGKTQTAIEYAYRYREEYQAIFWVRADSPGALLTDFVSIAEQLQLPERTLPDQRLIVEAVQRWLRINSGWLLIFDNVEEFTILDLFLPKSSRGHVLLTTRARGLGGIAQRIEIEQMQPEIGALFLLRRSGVLALPSPLEASPEDERSVALDIVAEMGGLPLALDQAGAYIRATSCTLSDYLELYRTRSTLLLEEQRSESDYPESVATTWSLSFEKVLQAAPVAVELLYLFAFLSPDAIPEEIITEGSVHMGDLLEPIAHNQLQLDLAMSEILKYSLISRHAEQSTFTMHRLVQVVLKASMSTPLQYLWAIRAVKAMSDTFPPVEFSTWSRCQRYLLHAQTCATLIEEWELHFASAARLLNQTAVYLRVRAQYAEAEPLYLQALRIWKQTLGSLHSNVAAALNNLAYLYEEWGKYEPVEQLYQLAQVIWEQTERQDHPLIAVCLSNRANLYVQQGKYEEAESLYQQALAIRLQKMGPEHPDTATIFHKLAALYLKQNRYEQAEELYQRAYAIRKQTLGAGHPETVTSLNGLAQFYQQRGKYREAEKLLEQANSLLEEILGLEHPEVASLLHNLASIYHGQGKYHLVEALYQRVLAIREQKQGPWHLLTAHALNNLATFYHDQGRYQEAEQAYQRARAIYQHAFGDSHPEGAAILGNLGELYRSQGQLDQAESFFLQALAVQEQILGPEHPDTTAILNNLALLYRERGNSVQAEQLYTQVLSLREQTLGKTHPRTALSMHNLADVYRDQGKLEQAEKLYLEAVAIWELAVGAEHLMLANAYNNLALLFVQQKRYEQAKELYLQAFPILIKFGKLEHPNMLTLLNNYFTLLDQMGQVEIILPEELREHYALLLRGIGRKSETQEQEGQNS